MRLRVVVIITISYRILPNGTDNNISQEGVKYYRTLFEELLKVHITPVVTLFHWDMPTPLMDLGGWTNPKIVDFFEDYVRVVFKLYGDIIKMWTTINEPHQHCYNVSWSSKKNRMLRQLYSFYGTSSNSITSALSLSYHY